MSSPNFVQDAESVSKKERRKSNFRNHQRREKKTKSPFGKISDTPTPMTPKLETSGIVLIVIAGLSAFLPFKIFGRGTTLSFQQYQDAKGSWVPFGLANSQFSQFLIGAALIAIVGIGMVTTSRILEKRRMKRVMQRRGK